MTKKQRRNVFSVVCYTVFAIVYGAWLYTSHTDQREEEGAVRAAASNSTQYEYDAAGNLVKKIQPDGEVITYTYNGFNQMETVTGKNGTTRYVYSGDERIAKVNPDGSTHYYFGNLSELDEQGNWINHIYLDPRDPATRIATKDQNGMHYYINDHLGSTSLVMNQSGQIEQRIDYEPFGVEHVNQVIAFNARHTFTGQRKDTETGLMYFGARYYDPMIGRFTQPDPAILTPDVQMQANPQLLNPYSYAVNNPLRYTDPDGKRPDEAVAGWAVGFVEGVGNTGIWLAQKISYPMQSVQDATSAVQAAINEFASTFSNPQQAFKEAAAGYGMSTQEFAEWYWNASDYERGKVLGHVTEKVVEGIVVAKVGGKVIESVTKIKIDQNKLHHIFDNKKHNLNSLVKEFGTQEKAFQAIQRATQTVVTEKQITGTFETTVTVGTQQITVRGKVVNGTVNIGTALKP